MSEAAATTFPAGVTPAEPAAAPAVDAPAAAPSSQVPAPPSKTPADKQRDAIYARRSAALAATEQPADAGGGEPAPVAPVDLQAMMEAEAAGTPYVPRPAAPAAAPAPAAPVAPRAGAPASAAPAAPLASLPTEFSITVEGRTMKVPAADVLRAGMATLQKETTADIRLQRVSSAERQLAAEREALDRRRAEIESSRAPAPAAGAPATSAPAHLPSGGANGGVRAATKKALDALLDSDTDGAAEALESVIAEQVEARVRATRAPAAPAAAPSGPPAARAPAAVPEAPWSGSEIASANLFFERAYQSVLTHPVLGVRATQLMQQEMANPVNRIGRVPLMELADRVGQEMSRQLSSASPPAPAVPAGAVVADELAARRHLALRVPGVPPSSSAGRQITAPTAPAFPSRSEIVQQMRAARHQG